MHIEDERIERLLHGELEDEETGRARAHLDACPECARRLAETEEDEARAFGLLERLDHPVPAISLRDIAGRRPLRPTRNLRWAAGVIGALGLCTAAYAAPGSPLPGWVRRLAETITQSSSASPPFRATGGEHASPAGISVAPGPQFTLAFSPAGWEGTVLISLEEVPEVSVEGMGTEAAFTMDTGLLLIEPQGTAGAFRVRIPVDAPRIDIRLAGEILFTKIGATVSTSLPRDDQGLYHLEVQAGVRGPYGWSWLSCRGSRTPRPGIRVSHLPAFTGSSFADPALERSTPEDPLSDFPVHRALPLILASSLLMACGDSTPTGPPYEPEIPTTWAPAVTNPLLPLVPGAVYTYEGDTEDGHETNTVEVLASTKTIMGVVASVVHDRVYLEGELIEETLDWYAQDEAGNVWYLGEDSKEIENGKVVSTKGSWEWGADGALPGVIMWADPASHIGEEYRQEYYRRKAEDWAKIVSVGQTVTVPFGTFTDCMKTEDWNALEKGTLETKYYCPGIGVTLEVMVKGGNDRTELVSVSGL